MNGWLGVDVGWVYPAADSDGNLYQWTHRPRPVEPVALAGPVRITTPSGRVRVEPPLDLRQAAIVEARADSGAVRRLAWSVVAAAQRTDRGVALEDWTSFERRKKAWIAVWRAIWNRATDREIPIAQVNRAYTSITCPECHHKGRENRPSRDAFCCVKCGYTGQADVIAAMNIAAKAAGQFELAAYRCTHCDEQNQWKAGLCLRCYMFRRRHGRLPSEIERERRARGQYGVSATSPYRWIDDGTYQKREWEGWLRVRDLNAQGLDALGRPLNGWRQP